MSEEIFYYHTETCYTHTFVEDSYNDVVHSRILILVFNNIKWLL